MGLHSHRLALVLWGVALSSLGCLPPGDHGRLESEQTPGGSTWDREDQVSCSSNDDCRGGEACEEGVCRMQRCAENFSSVAPMGPHHYFGTDGEIAVISDDAYVDAFELGDGYLASWDLTSEQVKVIDVAGGDLTGTRPHTIATAVAYSSKVRLEGPGELDEIDVDLWPIALSTGDTDRDGIDELIAISDDGEIALCHVDENRCEKATIDGVEGQDVAVGDVDGDGFAEPLLLIRSGGDSQVIVWNTDHEITGDESSHGWSFSFGVRALGAGRLREQATADIVLLEDRGWNGWKDDKLHVFDPAGGQFITTKNIDGHTEDLTVGDRDADERAEIAILREARKITTYALNDDGDVVSKGTTDVTVGSNPQRIAFVDWDGNSASGELVEGPELVAGASVPIAVLLLPPYPHAVAGGALAANVMLGDNESSSDSLSDTLALSIGMGVSYGAEAFGFKAKMGVTMGRSWSFTQSTQRSISIGGRYQVRANPELFGRSYAAVVMSCGCYHRYRYRTEDPAGLMGGSGQEMDLYIPVGGQTQLWSSTRYNAVAEAVPDLPHIEVPVQVGDPSSYPTELLTLDGAPVPAEDLLFPELPQFNVSDVGYVSFFLSAGESETNGVAETTTIGTNASFGAFGASVDVSADVSQSTGYSVTVGRSQIFAGGIPPVPDDPSTPEDEFLVNQYAFTPYIYRHHYEMSDGQDGGFYVLAFAVADPDGSVPQPKP